MSVRLYPNTALEKSQVDHYLLARIIRTVLKRDRVFEDYCGVRLMHFLLSLPLPKS